MASRVSRSIHVHVYAPGGSLGLFFTKGSTLEFPIPLEAPCLVFMLRPSSAPHTQPNVTSVLIVWHCHDNHLLCTAFFIFCEPFTTTINSCCVTATLPDFPAL